MKIYNGLTGEVVYEKRLKGYGGSAVRGYAIRTAKHLHENKDYMRISSTMIKMG